METVRKTLILVVILILGLIFVDPCACGKGCP